MRPDTNLKNLKTTGVTKAAHWETEKGGVLGRRWDFPQ